ncbi:MAG: group 1 truncated hemoglobin [Planctomycetota bacterium]
MNQDLEGNLFQRLGGAKQLADIIDNTYERVLADPTLSPFFENVPMERLRKMQFHFLAAAFDDPTEYSGAELTAAHAGRGIGADEFSRFCGHFLDACVFLGVPKDEINHAVARLALFRDKVTGDANVDG